MPRESKYADKVSFRDVKQAKIGDTVPIEESENKDRQIGSQESQNFQRRQGNYSSLQQRKQTVYVLGDSMIRNVRRQNISRESRMYYTHLKTFSGARVEEMNSKSYAYAKSYSYAKSRKILRLPLNLILERSPLKMLLSKSNNLIRKRLLRSILYPQEFLRKILMFSVQSFKICTTMVYPKVFSLKN